MPLMRSTQYPQIHNYTNTRDRFDEHNTSVSRHTITEENDGNTNHTVIVILCFFSFTSFEQLSRL